MRVSISTFGCKTNQADSDELTRKFLAAGCYLVRPGEPADLCVVNTCTVTAKADYQCRQMIRRLRRKNPSAKIVVTGCYANIAGEELRKMEEVDEVVSNADELHGPLTSYLLPPTSAGRSKKYEVGSRISTRTRPQVKIQDGCDRFCSYCIVPYARGRSRSVPPDEVLARVNEIKSAGYHEVVLTGIHMGGYGVDLEPPMTLRKLLEALCLKPQVSGNRPQDAQACGLWPAACSVPRIRLSSIDPDEWTQELIDFIARSPQICPHFHIPLQSGHDEILQKMRRRYTTENFKSQISNLKSQIPNCAIGTDVIVGFPGETERHFNRTMAFIESLPLSYIHVFPYSRRQLTEASRWRDDVPKGEKKRRVQELVRLGRAKKEAFYKGQLCKQLSIIIENRRDRKNDKLKGISENYVPVLLDSPDELFGKYCKVVVTNVKGLEVFGELYENHKRRKKTPQGI